MTIKDLCGKYLESINLRSFFEHVFSLNFKEEPDYNKLQLLLQKFMKEDEASEEQSQ